MNIPNEAVEAAMDQLPYQAADYVDTDTMRAALEATAPHMTIDPHDGFVAWFHSAGNEATK